jgi:diguanylate cyclase (GGDEF)-like protein
MGEGDFQSWSGQGVFGAFQKDPEREQALLRITLGTVVLFAYVAAAAAFHSQAVWATSGAVALYVVFGAATYLAAAHGPARSMLRLTLATFADQAVLLTALAIGGEVALPLLWVVFWFLLSVAATSLYLAVLVYRLEKQAATDPLTGLSNRARLEQAIARTLAARGPGAGHAALLLIDLDGFKEVNDDHGHAVGDELLRGFAMTLARQMRRGDTLARLGGDEFVVLAHHIHDRADALTAAGRIHAILGDIRTVGGHPVAISGSIGVCMLAEGTGAIPLDARALMRAADSAMYRAKARGNGRTAFADAAGMEQAQPAVLRQLP